MTTPALQPVYPLKVRACADGKPDDWLGEISIHGLRALWEQASPCPCQENADTEEGRFDCSVCGGTGWEYDTGMEIKTIVTSVTLRHAPYELFGRFGFGLVYFTMTPEQTPGFRDRLTVLDSAVVVQDLVKRTGTLDRLRWPVANRSLLLSVSGTPTPVSCSVLRLRRQASDGTAGPLLELDTDFALDAQGRIDWTKGDVAGTAPPVGASYSVRYFAHPRYLVMEQPHALRDTTTVFLSNNRKAVPRQYSPLPVRALAKLDWERRTG